MYFVQIDKETPQKHEWDDNDWDKGHGGLKFGDHSGIQKAVASRLEIGDVDHTDDLGELLKSLITQSSGPVHNGRSHGGVDNFEGEITECASNEVVYTRIGLAVSLTNEYWSFHWKSRQSSLDTSEGILGNQEESDTSDILLNSVIDLY